MALKSIVIVGAGPGGLTLARLLQMNDFDVKVFERDAGPEARVPGATLDLHAESGLKALAAAQLMDAFRENYRPGADRMRLMDGAGNTLFVDASTTDGGRPEIDRGPLRDLLLASLEPGTVQWDHQFVALERANGGVELTFKNGAKARADLLIGADGAHSKLRAALTPIRPEHCGYSIIEGAVTNAPARAPRLNQLIDGGKIFAFGDDKSLIISAKGDGALNFYFGFKAPASRTLGLLTREFACTWFQKEFAAWAPLWLELFEHADPKFIMRPLLRVPFDQNWETRADLTLIGDAAHVMPPYAGEGVNMAMLDARELTEALLSSHHVNLAIGNYETGMRARAAEIGRVSLEQTEVLHSPRAIESMLTLMNAN